MKKLEDNSKDKPISVGELIDSEKFQKELYRQSIEEKKINNSKK